MPPGGVQRDAHRRLSSYAPPAPFVAAAGKIARLTFAEVDGREPIARGAVPELAVVVWPTDDQGYLDEAAVRRGEARVTTWSPTAAELARLAELLAAGWDLARGDVLVEAGRVIPQIDSMRRSEWMPTA